MNIFPNSLKIADKLQQSSKKESKERKYKDLLFDPVTKQVVVKDGKTQNTNKKQEVQQWIFLFIYTEMEKYNVYKGTKFGIDFLYRVKGHEFYSSGFTIAQIKEELEEKLLLNSNIERVESINIKKGFNTLEFEIIVIVDNDLVKSEVRLDV